MLIYTARFVLPVTSPVIRDGAVAVDGSTIVSVGPRSSVLEALGAEAEVRDLGDVALLPGLVNAHTHLELSWMDGRLQSGDGYVGWLQRLLELREQQDASVAGPAAERALESMLERGTVAVGDVSNETWIVPILARSEMRGIAFHEILGFKSSEAESRLASAASRLDELAADPDVVAARDRLRVVLTPHGPHTTCGPLLRALAGRALASGEPLAIHVAESSAETSLLDDGSGPLSELFRSRGVWDDSWQPPHQTPVEHLDRLGVLTPRTLAVHCVHLEQHDHSKLQARRSTVVTCPRSNQRLGVGKAPVPKLLKQGIPVALGTDSLASSPSLDLFAEMLALREEHPEIPVAAVLRIATLNGARALGLHDLLGSIEPRKLACLAVVPLGEDEDQPVDSICRNPATVFALDRAPWSAAR